MGTMATCNESLSFESKKMKSCGLCRNLFQCNEMNCLKTPVHTGFRALGGRLYQVRLVHE